MAKDAKPAEVAEEAPKKKSKKLLIIIIAAVVVVLGIGGAAAFFLMHKNADHGDDEEVVAEKEKPKKKKKSEKEAPPAFVALDPFTVNLKQEQGEQYLQTTLTLEVEDAHVGDSLKTYMPKIRSRILNLLAEKKPSELMSKEGKDQLAETIQAEINEVMGSPPIKGKKADGPVKEVLFTSFIIQ